MRLSPRTALAALLAAGIALAAQLCSAAGAREGTIESVFVDGQGVRLHALRSGHAGPVVLLLHGFPLFSYMWEPQLHALADRARVYALDGRGFNLSDKPQRVNDYGLKALIADVIAVGDRISPDAPFILVGHDWGGAIAWATAKAYPHRVRHLLVANAPPHPLLLYLLRTDPAQQRSAAYLQRLMAADAEAALAADDFAALRATLGEILAARPASGGDPQRYLRAWTEPGALTGMLNWYRANLDAASIETATVEAAQSSVAVDMPVTLVWGDRDPVFSARIPRFVAEHGKRVELIRLSDAEHTPSLEDSAAFNRIIERILSP